MDKYWGLQKAVVLTVRLAFMTRNNWCLFYNSVALNIHKSQLRLHPRTLEHKEGKPLRTAKHDDRRARSWVTDCVEPSHRERAAKLRTYESNATGHRLAFAKVSYLEDLT